MQAVSALPRDWCASMAFAVRPRLLLTRSRHEVTVRQGLDHWHLPLLLFWLLTHREGNCGGNFLYTVPVENLLSPYCIRYLPAFNESWNSKEDLTTTARTHLLYIWSKEKPLIIQDLLKCLWTEYSWTRTEFLEKPEAREVFICCFFWGSYFAPASNLSKSLLLSLLVSSLLLQKMEPPPTMQW